MRYSPAPEAIPARGMVFCDLDGTLVDSRTDLASAVNQSRLQLGLHPLPQGKIVSFVGNGVRKLVERAFDGEAVDIPLAVEKVKGNYSRCMLDTTRLYDGVAEGLRMIRAANFAIAVLSNKTQAEAEAILDGLGVASFFSAIAGDGGGIALKPDPAAVLEIAGRLHAPLADSWILGDNWTDLECGRRAGIRRAFASYGFGNRRNEDCDFVAESFLSFAKSIAA